MNISNKKYIGLLCLYMLSIQLSWSQSKVVYNSTISTIDGKLFFPKGTYTGNNPDLDKIKETGFNVVMNYGTRDMSVSAGEKFLDDVHERGMYVLYYISQSDVKSGNTSNVINLVEKLKDHPALYAWYLSDEPGLQGISVDNLKIFYDWVKTTDAEHPVFTSNWQIAKYAETTDVDMRQLYHGKPSKMRQVLSDNNDGYVTLMKSLNKSWLAIINTHASDWAHPDGQDRLLYPSPSVWYKDVNNGSPEYTRRVERAEDLNHPDVIGNPFGKTDRYDLEFIMPDHFPDSESRIRGQVASALAYRSNALFTWLWSDLTTIHDRWGWYTSYDYEPTKNSMKKVLAELKQFDTFLLGSKVSDDQIYVDGVLFRYIKDYLDNEIIIVVNETEEVKDLLLPIPSRARSTYKHLESGVEMDLLSEKIHVDPNGGVFLFYASNKVLSAEIKKDLNGGLTLNQNFPNPFNESTLISYTLANDASVELKIVNALGQTVRTFKYVKQRKGDHSIEWNGENDSGQAQSEGIYFCSLKTTNSSLLIKLYLQD